MQILIAPVLLISRNKSAYTNNLDIVAEVVDACIFNFLKMKVIPVSLY